MVLDSPIISGSATFLGNLIVTGSIISSGSITISGSIASASYAATASFANAFTVANTLTAQTLVVQTITSSVEYSSGSNVFGNSVSNTHQFTGSLLVSGSMNVNANSLVVNSNGTISIGNTNNTYNLDVTGTGRFTSTLNVGNASSTPQTLTVNGNAAVGGQQAFWLRDDDGFSSSSARRAWAMTANYVAFGMLSFYGASAANSNPLSGTAFLNITSGGNVLIGTTTDSGYKLDVNGTGRFSGIINTSGARVNILGGNQNTVWFNQNAGGSSTGFLVGRSYSNDDANDFFIYNIATATKNFGISSTGAATFSSSVTATGNNANIFQGAGATTGYQYGSIQNSGGNFLFGVAGSNGSFWGGGNGGAYFSTIGTTTATNFVIATNNVGVATFTSGGNVGIGTTTPNYKLHITPAATYGNAEDGNICIMANPSGGTATSPTTVGAIIFGDNNATNGYMGRIATIQDNPSSSTASHMRFYTNSGGGNGATTERMRITSGGNIGIGTTSPSYKLTVAGTIGATDMILGSTFSYSYTTDSTWQSGMQTIIPANVLNAGTTYLVKLWWIYGSGSSSPYYAIASTLINPCIQNGTGTGNAISLLTSNHTPSSAAYFNVATLGGGGFHSSGLVVQFMNFASAGGTLSVWVTQIA
jgi:hypothetical protein